MFSHNLFSYISSVVEEEINVLLFQNSQRGLLVRFINSPLSQTVRGYVKGEKSMRKSYLLWLWIYGKYKINEWIFSVFPWFLKKVPPFARSEILKKLKKIKQKEIRRVKRLRMQIWNVREIRCFAFLRKIYNEEVMDPLYFWGIWLEGNNIFITLYA